VDACAQVATQCLYGRRQIAPVVSIRAGKDRVGQQGGARGMLGFGRQKWHAEPHLDEGNIALTHDNDPQPVVESPFGAARLPRSTGTPQRRNGLRPASPTLRGTHRPPPAISSTTARRSGLSAAAPA